MIGSHVHLFLDWRKRRIQSWWVCDDPQGTFFLGGTICRGMLGGSELIYPGSKESSENKNPLAQAHWDPSQKHDGLLVLAVNMTLDAATAHPALLLSEEGRASFLARKGVKKFPAPQRFISIPCVLGQLRIISGRYSGTWGWGHLFLGPGSFDRDNVTRNGRCNVPKNGFWAIRLYEESIGPSPQTHLTLREKPFIVRVFLDYESWRCIFL